MDRIVNWEVIHLATKGILVVVVVVVVVVVLISMVMLSDMMEGIKRLGYGDSHKLMDMVSLGEMAMTVVIVTATVTMVIQDGEIFAWWWL